MKSGAAPHANDTMSFALPIADIGELPADQYVGLIDPDAIACLTARFATEGLLTPIWVRRNGNAAEHRWSVIAGRHRLRAAAQLGWTEIAAEQRADSSGNAAELRRLQIAENLDRRTLRPIERACFVMERWREAAAVLKPSAPRNQQSVAIRERWSVSATVADTGAVDLATAEACGLARRSIERSRAIYAALVGGLPDLFAALNAHPIGANARAMETLAGFPEPKRLAAARAILANPECESLKQVLKKAGIEQSNGIAAQDAGSRILHAIGRLSRPAKRNLVLAVNEDATPALAQEVVARWKAKGVLS